MDHNILPSADLSKPYEENSVERFFNQDPTEEENAVCAPDETLTHFGGNGKKEQQTKRSNGNGKRKQQAKGSCDDSKKKCIVDLETVCERPVESGDRVKAVDTSFPTTLAFDQQQQQLQQEWRHREQYLSRRLADHRTILWHPNTIAALAINDRGYTVSTGVQSWSFDGVRDWFSVVDTIVQVKVLDLYLVDADTEEMWKRLKEKYHKLVGHVRERRLEPDESGDLCWYCREPGCHRWKATVQGIYRVLKMNVEPIKHNRVSRRMCI